MKKIFLATGFVVTLVLSALPALAQTQPREDILREIEAKRAELAALEQRFLSPSEDDRATYADFLRQRDTGLIRLLPREKFGNHSLKRGLTMNGGGAFYSFTRLTHEYGHGSDIALEQGYLSTGFAGANYGIMTSLGDIPLENVTSDTVQFMASHAPAADEPKARIEQRRWQTGETIEGTKYAERLLLKPNTTYVLRSIDYDRSDMLVAFRVVRVDNDDSATILWKLLRKYPTPRLARND